MKQSLNKHQAEVFQQISKQNHNNWDKKTS